MGNLCIGCQGDLPYPKYWLDFPDKSICLGCYLAYKDSEIRRLTGLLRECAAVMDYTAKIVPGMTPNHILLILKDQAQLLLPDLAEFKEKPADDRNDPFNLRHNDW